MKILVNNFSALKTEQEKMTKYPIKYNCQICGSELELNETDIKNVDVPLIGKNETVKGLGFICPACNQLNITG